MKAVKASPTRPAASASRPEASATRPVASATRPGPAVSISTFQKVLIGARWEADPYQEIKKSADSTDLARLRPRLHAEAARPFGPAALGLSYVSKSR